MAVRFDNVADCLVRTASAPNANAPFTFMSWWYIVTDLADTGTMMGLYSPSNPAALIGIDNSLNLRFLDSDVGGTTTGSNIGTGAWHHVAWVRSAGNVHTAYFDGVADGITLGASSGITSPYVRLSQDASGAWVNGRVEAAKLWTAALTQAEISAERFRYDPVVTANNWAWWPLTVHTDLTDHSANARHFTANGTLTTEAGQGSITTGGGATFSLPGGAGTASYDITGVAAVPFPQQIQTWLRVGR